LRNLESVNLAENELREIPRWVLDMPHLQTFYISGNQIPRAEVAEFERLRPGIEFDHPFEDQR
jgi:hypothetical protein